MKVFRFIYLVAIVLLSACSGSSSKESVNDTEYVRSQLNEVLERCYQVNEEYATVSKVMNAPNFNQLCEFAGWAPNKGAAMTMRANGTYNLTISMDIAIEKAYVEAEKSNAHNLSRVISNAKHSIGRIKENSSLALHANSESDYDKYMDWALNANNKAIKEVNKAIGLLP